MDCPSFVDVADPGIAIDALPRFVSTPHGDRIVNHLRPERSLLALIVAIVAGLGIALPAPPAWADDAHDETREHREHDDHDDNNDHDEHEEDEDHFDEMEYFVLELETYGRLLDLVHSFAEVAESPGRSGVAAVMAVEEHAGEPEEIVDFFESILDDVENEVVKRAIRLKLVDMYAEIGNREAALDQLRMLITTEE